MKKLLREFKAFINKGNVIDLAVAVIIGAAFGKIVSSLVEDVITPLTSLVIGSVDIVDLKWVIIKAAADGAGEVAVMYGKFLKNVMDFLIIAVSIFFAIKFYNRATRNIQKQIEKSGEQIKARLSAQKTADCADKDDGAAEAAESGDNGRESHAESNASAVGEENGILKEIRDLLKNHIEKGGGRS
ncbi:MAG: large conductance mechanosensitive channel protein MscL [Clostridiales bacterium]|nr:large conductance mechanosensitive channel protein MscL [Clostridiales bacterium]